MDAIQFQEVQTQWTERIWFELRTANTRLRKSVGVVCSWKQASTDYPGCKVYEEAFAVVNCNGVYLADFPNWILIGPPERCDSRGAYWTPTR